MNTSKLSENEVISIINRRAAGEMSREVYSDFKDIIKWSSFQSIWSGNHWKYLQPAKEDIIIAKGASSMPLAKVIDIKKSLKSGMKTADVARKYNIPYKRVYYIKTGLTYNYITV